MKVFITHASIGETGKTKGNRSGDQTKKEVCTREWYSNGWTCVIRFKNPLQRIRIAECMRRAAGNDNIGYDQNNRNSLLNHVRGAGYDPGRAVMKVDTDCSALVTLACIYAGIPEAVMVTAGNSCTTRNLKNVLAKTGMVDIFYTKEYTMYMDRLEIGDILLKEGYHVAAVTDKTITDVPKKSVAQIAQEVIDGKWGNGAERKRRLADSGYDYSQVQVAVNKIKKG